MSLLACSLLGLLCTALSFVWLFATQFIPFFSTIHPTAIGIVSLVVFLIIVFISNFRKNTFTKILFFVIAPITFAGFLIFADVDTAFFQQVWWMSLLAVGAALLLMLIYIVILNAMIVAEHRFAMWLACAFFFAITIGIYFVLKSWLSADFALIFSWCAILSVSSISGVLDLDM